MDASCVLFYVHICAFVGLITKWCKINFYSTKVGNYLDLIYLDVWVAVRYNNVNNGGSEYEIN